MPHSLIALDLQNHPPLLYVFSWALILFFLLLLTLSRLSSNVSVYMKLWMSHCDLPGGGICALSVLFAWHEIGVQYLVVKSERSLWAHLCNAATILFYLAYISQTVPPWTSLGPILEWAEIHWGTKDAIIRTSHSPSGINNSSFLNFRFLHQHHISQLSKAYRPNQSIYGGGGWSG